MARNIKIRIIAKDSCCTAQKTLPLGYKNQEVNATWGNKPSAHTKHLNTRHGLQG